MTCMEGLELNIQPYAKIAKNTPMETRLVSEVKVTFLDGTELILPVEDENGFYRTSDYLNKGVGFTNHEIFIAYPKGM